ncbi:MAG: outer membrane protein assembly factor BamC [Zoogloeaceae bacterium]|jgi:outer membrane protein assembly factor BamC|nr:outer membrane protein assembly factor BamC [Zoogloeaceae bacterium]
MHASRQISLFTLLLLSATLAGCAGSLIPETKKIDYKSASNRAPSLEVPPDLTQIARDDRFAVPDFSGKGSATYSEYSADRKPEAQVKNSSVLPEVDNIRVERAGSQRWLVVKTQPERLWDSTRDFWQELGFIINTEVPEAGIMETDWAENRANIPSDFIRNTIGKLLDALYSTGERDKFRTRFEPGSEPGTTDIFISHRRMEEVYTSAAKDDTRWQPAASDPELEAEMLRRLMVRLGTDERRAEAAIASANVDERARLVRSDDGAGVLEVQERFDRAWRRVGLSMDRVGFTVEDRDRSRGLYFVRYVDPETDNRKKDDGWFARLWTRDNKATPQVQYRVHLQEVGDNTRVQILSAEGGVDRSDTARKILGLLLEQLK